MQFDLPVPEKPSEKRKWRAGLISIDKFYFIDLL
jgi:hypothetical protein